MAALSLVITSKGAYFLADTHVQPDPTAEEIADMTIACAEPCRAASASQPKIALFVARRFRLRRHALGPEDARRRSASSVERAPELEVDGEMQADTALSADDPRARLPGLAPARARPTS